jgi:hypothetical protein
MATPTPSQLDAGFRAGRKALEDYSSFDSGMVPDAALEVFVKEVITAALNVTEDTEGS